MEAIPLAPEDCSILALESETVAGHTCKVVLLRPPAPDATALQALLAERIEHAPALCRCLGGTTDTPAWVPDERFDIADHVCELPVDEPLERSDLPAAVTRLFEQRLDRARPLWRIDVVPMSDGGRALVWRIHHALADGTAAMRFARLLLWDKAAGAGEAGVSPHGSAADHAAAAADHPGDHDDARRRRHLCAFFERELAGSCSRSPFDGRIGTTRQIAFACTPLPALHDAAKALGGATLNDAVLTCVAGALRRWLESHHGHVGKLRVRVPVSLHKEGDEAGNRDSFFTLGLPLAEANPVARLRQIHAATSVRKEEHDADAVDELLSDIGRISPRLERFATRVESSPRSFALAVSNVPGPRAHVSVGGAPVEELYSLAEIGDHHALRVAVVSLAGMLCFGFCADPGIVEELGIMAEAVEAEAADLIARAPE